MCVVVAGTDWVDPHDPTVIAEKELLSAANQIEAAAKKLAMLQPRVKPKVSRGHGCIAVRVSGRKVVMALVRLWPNGSRVLCWSNNNITDNVLKITVRTADEDND